jgi:hypothetical protein
MVLIELNKKHYPIPTCWDELSGKQLVKIMRVFDSSVSSIIAGKVKLFKILCGLKWWAYRKCKPEEIAEYLYLIDFLLKENTITKNVLPSYSGYYGPADDFQNLLMVEFIFSEDFYLRWKEQESDITNLNSLVGVLYRQKKRFYNLKKNIDGDPRVFFNENLARYTADVIIKNWPLHVKKSIAFWYEGCRLKMINDYSQVFSGAGGDPAKYGLISIIRNVAEKGIHGKFKEVEQQYVRIIMMELDEMMTEAKKIENLSKV